MKRAVICVDNPQDFIPQLTNYSLMILNPNASAARNQYLLDKSDYSLLINNRGHHYRDGGFYPGERLLWYTSGTTGDSKFCSFTQEQLDLMTDRVCKLYDITANDRYVSIMGLWHAHGQGFYWITQRAGCEVSYLNVKEIRNIGKHNPTFITAIPDMLRVMTQQQMPSLRFVRSASAPLPVELYQNLSSHFGVPIVEAFGMTETLSQCFTNPLHGEQRLGTVGLPDGVEADIVDGHLYVRGPTICTTTGWFDTGDLADQDDRGYYRILGRSRDQINIRGLKLNPTSLESKLRDNVPGLRDCVVFGSNAVKCLYVGDCETAEVRRYLISMGPHCRPSLLQSVDSIPISPSGKISRSWLDTQFS
jgi:acyl-coenzyme A synthetase/AMP-(fatty) acid ligase